MDPDLFFRPGRPSGLILSPDGRLKTSPDGRPGLCRHPDLFCRERKQVRMAAGRHPDLFCVDPRFGVKSRHSSEQVRVAARVSVSIRTCFCFRSRRNKSGDPGGHPDLFSFSHGETRKISPDARPGVLSPDPRQKSRILLLFRNVVSGVIEL